jgi:hypothetical protein
MWLKNTCRGVYLYEFAVRLAGVRTAEVENRDAASDAERNWN